MQEALSLSLFSTIETVPKSDLGISTLSLPNNNNPQTPIENAINSIFIKPGDEIRIIQVKNELGEISNVLSFEQIEVTASQFQFLIDGWLDEFEKEVFKGMTLKEVLNEG